MNPDMNQVEAFAGQVVTDVAAAMSGVMTSLGDKLGLYKAMADAGPLTSGALASKTGLHERYVREWLNNQVAGGYIIYQPQDGTYELPDAHALVLAVDGSPVFLVPALEVCASLWFDRDKIEDAFRSGDGIAWKDHHEGLFCGCEALFKPGYEASLVADWIGALDGVPARLAAGGKIADVGCGHGASAIILADAFPNSTVYGFDSHRESINIARQRASDAGLSGNLHFETALAKGYEERDFDLICFMDCLHDMGDPIGAARHACNALKPDGTLLLVEPAADDGVENNINPVSRLYYAASTGVCTPCSLSQEVREGLGAQAGPGRLADVLGEAGFSTVRVAARTPFNIILEARKG
ncbi:class I SAM-dependent methyltransferase [Hyphomonas johnsonii]|uniref:Methylase n=1 Tax=Hyphomonas johnsonii MHS-2 TaxID=1280950 RepID=A0A059FT99_9PROT|nr:methyltransferase domain-containing protein [Hyphomonas johnsonii]KCZ93894.1 methylase [Hyphomonas johnsonii MHS-2]